MAQKRANPRLPIMPNARYHVSPAANHTCRLCARGCYHFTITLTDQEARRLAFDFWRPLLHDVPDDLPLVRLVNGQYVLNKKADGACVFLDSDNLCIVHKESGAAAKPLVCQLFPLQAVQAPDGVHVSLNPGCRRLIEMTGQDALPGEDEVARLFAGAIDIITLGEMVRLTPGEAIPYEAFVGWQERLMDVVARPQADYATYWQALREGAALLLPLYTGMPASGMTWQSLFVAVETHNTWLLGNREGVPETRLGLAQRAARWLPALTAPDARLSPPPDLPGGAPFCAAIARQFLEGRQVAFHQTARDGWTGLIIAIVAAMLGTHYLLNSAPYPAPGHLLNDVLADAMALFALSAGKFTESEQQAFLTALAGS